MFAILLVISSIRQIKNSDKVIAKTEDINFENDFVSLGNVCNITRIQNTIFIFEDSRGKDFCWYSYTLSFTVALGDEVDEDVTYDEYPQDEAFSDPDVNCVNGGEPTYQTYALIAGDYYNVGDVVECWKPRPGRGDSSSLSSLYQCGNDMCYKIFDPVESIIELFLEATSTRLISIVTLAVLGAICCGCCGWLAVGLRGLNRQAAERELVVTSYERTGVRPPIEDLVNAYTTEVPTSSRFGASSRFGGDFAPSQITTTLRGYTDSIRSQGALEQDCSICLELLTNTSRRLRGCGHMFHYECIKAWVDEGNKYSKKTCPNCRQPVKVN